MQSRPPNPQMDISSLPESEQQKLRQLQQQFQEHLAQQQAQQQQQQLQQQLYQAYDHSQTQTYEFDQTNQAYYSYYHQQYPQQSHNPLQQDPQQYPYYQPDYSAAYQHAPPPEQVPAVAALQISYSGAAQPSGVGQVQAQHQQDANYPVQSQEQQQSAGYTAPPGLNAAAAAAVAALSQLTQFAGTMDAAERAMAGLQGNGYGPMMGHESRPMHRGPGSMHPPFGQSPYRGGGRRRGGSLRGGGRGNFGHHHPRPGGSCPPLRGRGRGRGRGGPRRFPPHGAASTSSHPEHSAAEDAELTDDEEESPADTPEEGAHAAAPPELSLSALALEIAAPNRRLPQVGWCELCRVDCNTLEILEQHKNGKRHKKNLQKIEELKNALNPGDEMQNEQKSIDDSNPEASRQPESAHDDEENIPTEAVGDDTAMESEQTNNRLGQHVLVEGSSDLQARNSRMNWFDNERRGMKRKMRGGRGGKRMKTFEGPRRPFETPKPKMVIPLMCNLCNIKCDTQEVFNRHLSGKKHLAKQKRYEGHQAMYGPMGLQALYPPNPIAQSLFHPQDHQQHFHGPQGTFPPEAFMPSQGHQAASASASFDPQIQQHPNPQWPEASHS